MTTPFTFVPVFAAANRCFSSVYFARCPPRILRTTSRPPGVASPCCVAVFLAFSTSSPTHETHPLRGSRDCPSRFSPAAGCCGRSAGAWRPHIACPGSGRCRGPGNRHRQCQCRRLGCRPVQTPGRWPGGPWWPRGHSGHPRPDGRTVLGHGLHQPADQGPAGPERGRRAAQRSVHPYGPWLRQLPGKLLRARLPAVLG